MSVKVSSTLSGENLLESGAIILRDEEIFTVNLEEGNDRINLEFLFKTIPGSGLATNTEDRGNDTLRLILVNWTTAGFDKTQVGNLNGRPVYLVVMSSHPFPNTHIL